MNRRQAEETLAEVLAAGTKQRPGMKAVLINADVSQAEEVDRMFAETRRSLGPIDILVNNAGVYPRTPLLELDPQTFDKMIDVHLKGAYLCARAITPDLIQKGYGKIINVSSVTVHLGIHEGLAHYISAKAGVIGLTRALARELGKYNVQVNTISPGAIQVEAAVADGAGSRARPGRPGFLPQRAAMPQAPGHPRGHGRRIPLPGLPRKRFYHGAAHQCGWGLGDVLKPQ